MGNQQASAASQPQQAAQNTSVTLDYSGQGLKSLDSVDLSQFVALTSLNLSSNELHSAKQLAKLRATLKELDLSSNPFGDSLQQALEAQELAQLTNLEVLKLSSAQIAQIGSWIGGFKLLRRLDLSVNRLKVFPAEICSLSSLDYFNGSSNEIIEIPKAISQLKSLKTLILNKNSLKSVPKEIGGLSSLVLLNLADNFIAELPAELSKLTSLAKLYIDHNELLELTPEIGKITTLRELNISANQLIELPPSFANLANLQILDLEENEFANKQYTNPNLDELRKFLAGVKPSRLPTGPRHKKMRSRTVTDASFRVTLASSRTLATEDSFVFVDAKKKLFQFKGKNNIVVSLVESALASLSRKDAFLLDDGRSMYVFVSKTTDARKQAKAAYFAQQMAKEQGGNTDVLTITNGVTPEKGKQTAVEKFWKALGAPAGAPPTITADGASDSEVETEALLSQKLFRFSEATGKMEIMAWMGTELSRDYLDSSSCFVLDCGTMVFLWSGVYSSSSEKTWAMLKAEELVGQAGRMRPACTDLFWILDGEESVLFRDKFVDWADRSWDVRPMTEGSKSEQPILRKTISSPTGLSSSEQRHKSIGQSSYEQLAALRKEGWVNRKKAHKWKRCYCVLDLAEMNIYKDQDSMQRGSMPKEVVSVDGAQFAEHPSKDYPYAFQVTLGGKSLILQAEKGTDTEMQDWLNTILKHQILASEPDCVGSYAFVSPLKKTLSRNASEDDQGSAAVASTPVVSPTPSRERSVTPAKPIALSFEAAEPVQTTPVKPTRPPPKPDDIESPSPAPAQPPASPAPSATKTALDPRQYLKQHAKDKAVEPHVAEPAKAVPPPAAVEPAKPAAAVEAASAASVLSVPAAAAAAVESKSPRKSSRREDASSGSSSKAAGSKSSRAEPEAASAAVEDKREKKEKKEKKERKEKKQKKQRRHLRQQESDASLQDYAVEPAAAKAPEPQAAPPPTLEPKPAEKPSPAPSAAPAAATNDAAPAPTPEEAKRRIALEEAAKRARSEAAMLERMKKRELEKKESARPGSASGGLGSSAGRSSPAKPAEPTTASPASAAKPAAEPPSPAKPAATTAPKAEPASTAAKPVEARPEPKPAAAAKPEPAKAEPSKPVETAVKASKPAVQATPVQPEKPVDKPASKPEPAATTAKPSNAALLGALKAAKPEVPAVVVAETAKPEPAAPANDVEEQAEAKSGALKPAAAKKKAPSRNPVRAAQALAAQTQSDAKVAAAAEATKDGADKENTSTQTAKNATAARLNAQVGGYGLLYTLTQGADPSIFKKSLKQKTVTEATGAEVRLIQVKGRRSIFSRLVEPTVASLNKGDCFLLDTGKKNMIIYQWNGSESNRIAKGKAMDVAKSIKDKERSGAAKVVVIDDGQNDVPEFWAALGGKGNVASAKDGGDDQVVEKTVWSAVKLYKICYENPKTPFDQLELEEVASGRSLVKEMLDPNECYILDCTSEVYPWTGRNAPMAIKNSTIKLATHILSQRDCWTAPLIREFPGSESVLFKERFSNWGSGPPIQMQQVPVGLNVAAARKQETIDVLNLHKPGRRPEEVLVDDGSGKLSIWRVEDFKKVEVPKEQYGEFYSGESYLILYTYIFKNKDCYLIYFWQGRNSSINEKGASALLTIELDEQLKANISGSAKEVRVVQNKEPHHFMLIFKHKYLVHLGKDPLGKDFKEARSGNRLYQVQATNSWNLRALEMQPFSYNLCSQSVCVVKSAQGPVHVWHGRASSPEEQAYAATNFGKSGASAAKTVEEGRETAEFWSLFETGKQPYPLASLKQRLTTRLWVCSIGSGVFQVEEIFNFCQDDLIAEDVFMLDARDDIYVWIGKLADDKEKSMSYQLAVDYAKSAPDGRDGQKLAGRVWLVLQGHEPLIFTGHFHGWDVSKYPTRHQEFSAGLTSVEKILAEYNRKYTLEELQSKSYPKGLDTARLEQYLSDDDFMQAFGVAKDEFEAWPIWKKQKTKRELLLF